jgi:hypothetical protein
MIEAGLQQRITSSDAFAAIANTRLHPVLLPEEAPLPAATYQSISTRPLYTLEDRVTLTEVRIQFDTWATSYGPAKALMSAIDAAIDNFTGVLSEGTRVLGVQLLTSGDLYESAARIYRVTADYKVQYVG